MMPPTGPSDDAAPAALLDYAERAPAPGKDDDARDIIGCLLAWLVLVSGLFTGMAWLFWSAVHTL